MTGFGDAAEQVDGIHYAVELRSLNNRYFKSAIRLPEEIAGLEAELETFLRKRLSRGSITLTVKMRQAGAQAAQQVNDAALLVYLDHLETLHTRVNTDYKGKQIAIDLTALMALPGVLQPSEEADTLLARARPVLQRLVDKACRRLTAMRIADGQAIARDLAKQRKIIHLRLSHIAKRAPQVIEEYHQRLRARIDELLARAELTVGQQDLVREVAIFAERSDISEEVSRASAHLDQFEEIVKSKDPDPAGRTLDFLAQELLREANTIASKSNDGQIARGIVEVKGAIDRIKEQVQNVE